MARAEPRWRVVDTGGFDSRQWGDDIVLYVAATGETHALAPAHSATLALLLEQPGPPRTAAEWLALMPGDIEPDASPAQQDDADLNAIDQALADLHRIGVVERLPA